VAHDGKMTGAMVSGRLFEGAVFFLKWFLIGIASEFPSNITQTFESSILIKVDFYDYLVPHCLNSCRFIG